MRGERGATQAMVDEAVHASMLAHGGDTLTLTLTLSLTLNLT